jgi:hypothetical protein
MRNIVLMCGLVAAPVLAQNALGDVAVTIYNDNLALVQDTRKIAIPAGRVTHEFPDVSGQIRPETVTLSGGGFEVVEQNFDFDLLSPQAMMTKALGETITLVRTNPASGQEMRERATVLAVNGGVVLRIGDRIEVLRDDGLPVRVIFDRVPENLRARPTLSVTLEGTRAGTRPVTLSYLTPGLAWKADYVALFDERAGKIDVQGWITLSNSTGTTFANANTLLVAGQVRQASRRGYYPQPQERTGTIREAGSESAARDRLGDFYLYPLAERTTIANQQTKQVSFLDAVGAPGRKGYEYTVGWMEAPDEPQSFATVLKFSTSRNQGLGDALPSGVVRVYMKDARGNSQFVGESAIDHTPMGSELGLTTGEAFDVKVKPVVESRKKITLQEWETTSRFRIWNGSGDLVGRGESDRLKTTEFWRTLMSYRISNARPDAVTVDLVQNGLSRYYWNDSRLVESSHPSEKLDADKLRWRVQVPANSSVTVTATFDTRY